MYSRVKIAGHPVHPMLVGFPIAFYTATLASFIVYGATANEFWFRVGYVANLAGVIMAFMAALPGFVDWASGIPEFHEAKKTGLIHMGLNLIALILYAANAWLISGQFNDVKPDANGSIALTCVGFLVTLFAGYFGWTLVQTHHVGVDLTPAQEHLEPLSRGTFIHDHPHRRIT